MQKSRTVFESILLAGALALGIAFAGCHECESPTDCAVGQACRDNKCVAIASGFEVPDASEPVETESCEKADALPELPFAKAGLLENAEYWDCPWPGESATFTGGFTTAELTAVSVSGIPVPLVLEWTGVDSLEGRNIVMTSRPLDSKGYYVIPGEAGSSPLETAVHLASGLGDAKITMRFAIDDGTGQGADRQIGGTLSKAFNVVGVGQGDLQVNLHWNTLTDMDLHVIEPSGEEVFFGNTPSASGGQLDLDSYAACSFEDDRGLGNENIFWETGTAPSGEYVVVVHMFSDCGTFDRNEQTGWRVTVVKNHTEVSFFEGVIGESTEQEQEVTRITY